VGLYASRAFQFWNSENMNFIYDHFWIGIFSIHYCIGFYFMFKDIILNKDCSFSKKSFSGKIISFLIIIFSSSLGAFIIPILKKINEWNDVLANHRRKIH
jgi:hypothetical protein